MAKNKRSRKGKKEWRKNVDVSKELEALQARDVVAKLAATPDHALFMLDTKAAATPVPLQSRQERKEHYRAVRLHADSRLLGHATKTIAKTHGADSRRIARLAARIKADLAAKPDAAATTATDAVPEEPGSNRATSSSARFTVDLWAAPAPAQSNTVKRIIASKEAVVVRRPLLVGGPGSSYRPDHEQHQEYLGARLAREIRREDHAAHLRHRLASTPAVDDEQGITADVAFSTLPTRATLSDRVATAAADGEEEQQEQEDSASSTAEADTGTTATKLHYSIKLSQTERNKLMRRRIHEAIVRKNKMRKRYLAQFTKLSHIEAKLKAREVLLEARRKQKLAVERAKSSAPKRLGKLRYEAPDTPFLLTEELPNSMRTLAPQGNLATELFKRMQRKNLIEPRVPATQGRRYPKKLKERYSARD